MDKGLKENIAHLLASMHMAIREHDEADFTHLNNLIFAKFVEKYIFC
jgi:hypothetical protein